MRLCTLLVLSIMIIGCKHQDANTSTNPARSVATLRPVNDKELLDSLKNQYKEHYNKVKDPEQYERYLGTTDFCYDEERLKIHKALFSNTKDERLTNKKLGYGSHEKASDSLLNSFTIKERLVFAFVYPEFHSQTCGMFIDLDNFHNDVIFPLSLQGPEGFYASNRQLKALLKNKDSVAYYLNACYKHEVNIPIEIYSYIRKLDLYESIPMLLEQYNKKGNPFITGTFVTMMVEDNYQPFMKSRLLNDMKGRLYNDGDSAYMLNSVENTPERIKELFFHIQNYYEWKSQG